MNLWSRTLQFFRESTPELDPVKAEREGSTAWGGENSWFATLRKYNPDDLIGRKGFQIYGRMMLDEQVKAAVQFRRAAVTGRDWYFELDADRAGLGEEEARRRITVNTDMIKEGYKGLFVDGLNCVMRAVWQGCSWSEIMIGQFESAGKIYYGLEKLRPKPYHTFEAEVNDFGDVLRWVQKRPGGGQEREVDVTKLVHYVNGPDMDEHYGQSELRSAYRWWFAKDFTIKFMNVFAERLAGGFVVAAPTEPQYAVARNSPEFTALTQALANINGSTSMLMPAGYQAEMHFAPSGQSNVFETIIGMQDLAIAKSLLIPNLLGMSNPKAQTGSFSQGNTQFDIFIIVSDDDADRLADVLNEQVFRPLNRQNFEDGVGPILCFKPLSEGKKQELLRTWKDLVSSNAVEPSDTDEAHVRELLDFPEKGEPLVDPAAALVAPPGTTPPGSVASPEPDDERGGQATQESMQGRQFKTYSRDAFARAERRVAFQVLDRASTAEVAKWSARVEEAMAELVAEGVYRVEEMRLGTDAKTADQIGRFELSGMKAQQLNTQLRRALQAGMDLGRTHALTEVDSAKRERFSRRLDMERLGDLAAEWLKQKSFTITGDLKAGAVKEIKGVLMNGLKFGWTQKQVRDNVYKALISKGYISGATAAEALGISDTAALAEQLQIQGGLAAHRLDTVIRTNTFEAINEARLNAFTDPVLDGFVQALTYSSVLDSRTTSVCEHMDGRTYTNNQWVGELRPWVPPNHFNCRSLLIPVTAADEQPEFSAELPSIAPQEGFG